MSAEVKADSKKVEFNLSRVDFNALSVNERERLFEQVDDLYTYHDWTPEKVKRGVEVRKALAQATKAILIHVPPSADRTTALRNVRDARMNANSAITFDGQY